MEIPNWHSAVSQVKSILYSNLKIKEDARNYGTLYQGKRGLMVVDVVASRQRKYSEYVLPKLLPVYQTKAKDLSLMSLSAKAPTWMPLRTGEAEVMQLIAQRLREYGKSKGIYEEDALCLAWAEDELAHVDILNIKGIGPALLQYLRMRSGANSLKVDVRVIEALKKFGLPVEWFSPEGLLQLCTELATECNCSLLELDQALWHF